MFNINNLSLEDLLKLYEEVSSKLEEDYDFFNIVHAGKNLSRTVKNEDGSVQLIPFTSIYKNAADFYRQVKKSLDSQIEHLKEFPQLQAYLGTTVDRDTGIMFDQASRLILNKINSNNEKV